MKIVLTFHALRRMKQRGIGKLELLHALKYPVCIRKAHDGTRDALCIINNRRIRIIFVPMENYIKIITVI